MNSLTKTNYSPFISIIRDFIQNPKKSFFFLQQRILNQTSPSSFPIAYRKHIPLITSELPIEGRQAVIKTMSAWKQFAKDKAAQLPKPNIFHDSKDLCKWISEDLKKDPEGKTVRVFVCTDPIFNELQAISLVTDYSNENKPYFYLEFLATHPKNIPSPLNQDEPYPIAGAASSLISHLKNVGIQENRKKIKLYSLRSAEGFYKKLGFKTKNSEDFTLKL